MFKVGQIIKRGNSHYLVVSVNDSGLWLTVILRESGNCRIEFAKIDVQFFGYDSFSDSFEHIERK